MKLDMDVRARWRRASRRARMIVIVLAVLLIGLRLALPFAVKAYVNHQLNKSSEYGGQIGDVSMKLWRGGYRIHELRIFKKSGGVSVPFFEASELDLVIEWRELFHGALVGEVIIKQPQLNFVSGPTAEQTQTGTNEQWNQTLESLFPFKLNRLEIKRGQIHFQNQHSKPPVDIFVTELFATATNLTNTRDLKTELPAGVMAQGKTLGKGSVSFELQFNPLSPAPTYEAVCQLTNVDLTELNDFLKAYGKFDVDRGKFSFYTSIAAKDGTYEGYFKVFFENLDVFAWEKERQKNVLQIFWQAVVGSLSTVLKNQPNDRLAARIPISGSYENKSVGVWTAVTTLLQNAFIRALLPKLDEQLTIQEVEKNVAEKEQRSSQTNSLPPVNSKGSVLPKQP